MKASEALRPDTLAVAMSATAAVAVIGAISTPVVALAGYYFNKRTGEQNREANRELAAEAHRHERALKRIDRAYDDRKEAYRSALRLALAAVATVDDMAKVLREHGAEPVPWPPEADWRWAQAELGLFAEQETQSAYEAFLRSVMTFRDLHQQLGFARELPNFAGDPGEIRKALDACHGTVHRDLTKLRELLNRDLAQM